VRRTLAIGLAALLAAETLGAQGAPEIRARLIARGAPKSLADQVQKVVSAARRERLPTDPLADKALEGWAKRASPDRVLVAVRELHTRLGQARIAAAQAGLKPPPGGVVTAAAQALGRGMTAEDVRHLIQAAHGSRNAAAGLMVASSLAAQGFAHGVAAQAVEQTYQNGGTTSDVLELPSVTASLLARGLSRPDVGERILEGRPFRLDDSEVGSENGAVNRRALGRAADVPPGARGRSTSNPSTGRRTGP